jgi:hypothetical protein
MSKGDNSKIYNKICDKQAVVNLIVVVQRLMFAISKGLNKVGVSPLSPEDGNRSSLRNVVFSSF